MNILEVQGLTKKYGELTAVRSIDFAIREGEVFGLLGPNGAGKTSTINMLIGLARLTAGSVNLAGFDLARHPRKAQAMMGIVADESNLYEELNGFENLCFCASLYGMRKQAREKRARELLAQFSLSDAATKPFKAYSRGMKRKLVIAAAIIHHPKILFLDEPTTGIDVASARQTRTLIENLNRAGTTVLLTTHYIEEAERLCHRVAFIVNGELIRTGTPDELVRETQKETVVQFSLDPLTPEAHQALQVAFSAFSATIEDGNTLRIRSPETIDLLPFMEFFKANGVIVYEARIIRRSLEEVFVNVTGIELERMRKEKEGRRR